MSGIPHPLSVVVGGRKWDLFFADYKTPDGAYSFYFYALSMEHASLILVDIKENAVLGGQVVDAFPAGGPS